jgi:glutamine synthetase
MNEASAVDAVLAEAANRGLQHVHFGFFDAYGHLIAKRSHVANLQKAMNDGTNMVAAIFSAAPSGTAMILSNPLVDPERGFSDGVLRMDAASCRDFPLEADGRGMLLLGEFVDTTGEYCVRHQLRRELERWQSLGLRVCGAFELECVMLDESPASIGKTSVNAVRVRPGYARPYQLVADPDARAFLESLDGLCERMGVAVDAQHQEFMHLLETSLRPELGLRIADNAALYKNMTKQLARERGYTASFMARWHHDHQGCGAHINLSLQDAASGACVFFDGAADDRLSPTLKHFVAGLQAYLPQLFLLLAPNLNSYKRFVPGLFTPLNNSWGIDNKTVAFRVVNRSAETARVEVRPAGADVSPHLGLLAVLVAGRLGITERLVPLDPVVGNGWAVADPPDRAFPLTFAAAIDAFAASEVARSCLGAQFVDMYVSDRRWQIEQFERAVTDWELQMFADGA